MPADIKLLLDEDVHLVLADALRRRGHDAVHVREVERPGLDDESQLKYAAEQRRCFVTFNVGEFVVWHGEYVSHDREHSGIIVSAQLPLGRMLREMLAFLQAHSEEEVRKPVVLPLMRLSRERKDTKCFLPQQS